MFKPSQSKVFQSIIAFSVGFLMLLLCTANAKCTVLDEIKCHLKAQESIEYIPQKIVPVEGSKKGRYKRGFNDTIMQEMVALFKKLPEKEYPAYLAWVEENLYDVPSPYVYNAVFVAYLLGEEQKAKELLYWYGRIHFYDGERCVGETFVLNKYGKTSSSYTNDPYSWYHSRATSASFHLQKLVKELYEPRVTGKDLHKLHYDLFEPEFYIKMHRVMRALVENPPVHTPIWACSHPPLTKKDWLVIKSKEKALKPVAIKDWISPQHEWKEDILHCYQVLEKILIRQKKIQKDWLTEENTQ